MSLKITTLIENMAEESNELAFEHGFSALIELNGKTILFDTGQSGAFADNAKALGKRLEEVDAVVLSHGHYDHTGGVPVLLEKLKENTPVYVGKEFFTPKYKKLEDGSYKYNGIPFEKEILTGKETRIQLNFIENDRTGIGEHLVLFKNFSCVTEYEKANPNFYIKTETGYEPDYFADEIALGILTEAGVVLVAGCSHAGIINILTHVKRTMDLPVAAVLGGTHLVEAGEERLLHTVEAIRAHGVKKIAVSHCTGEAGIKLLQKEFPEEFVLNNTGNILKF